MGLLTHLKMRNLHHQKALSKILIGDKTITLRCRDRHARFRYRGGKQPKNPIDKPAGGVKSY